MSNQFVTTKRVVNKVIDGLGPVRANMSVVPVRMGSINLVIGATYEDRCACAFNKDGIKELIDILSEILKALEE